MRTRRRDLGFGIWALGFVMAASAASAQTSAPWPTERQPAPLQPRAVQFPPYETKTLANGLQVVAVAHHEQPVVSLRLLVKAGATEDPQGKAGVAMLAAALLDQGTTTRNAEEIADQIDFIGGALGAGAGRDLSFVNSLVMKDAFAFGLELVHDVARNPAFAAEEIDRQKQQAELAVEFPVIVDVRGVNDTADIRPRIGQERAARRRLADADAEHVPVDREPLGAIAQVARLVVQAAADFDAGDTDGRRDSDRTPGTPRRAPPGSWRRRCRSPGGTGRNRVRRRSWCPRQSAGRRSTGARR